MRKDEMTNRSNFPRIMQKILGMNIYCGYILDVVVSIVGCATKVHENYLRQAEQLLRSI